MFNGRSECGHPNLHTFLRHHDSSLSTAPVPCFIPPLPRFQFLTPRLRVIWTIFYSCLLNIQFHDCSYFLSPVYHCPPILTPWCAVLPLYLLYLGHASFSSHFRTLTRTSVTNTSIRRLVLPTDLGCGLRHYAPVRSHEQGILYFSIEALLHLGGGDFRYDIQK